MHFQMFNATIRPLAFAAATALSIASIVTLPTSALAQDSDATTTEAEIPREVTPDTVQVTVNGRSITESEIELTIEQFADQLQGAPDEMARSVVVQYLIDLKLVAGEAEEANVEETDDFRRRLEFTREQVLRQLFLTDVISNSITDQDIQTAYEAQIADFTPETEIRARHILVETEERAKELITELDGGADFAVLALNNSTGPSSVQGGDLGFFGRGQMVPEFEAAAFELEAGAYSAEPVETQFGFHIIKIEESRETAPPALTDLEGQLREQLMRTRYEDRLNALKETAEVVYNDPALELQE